MVKKMLLWVVACVALSGSALFAQDMAGNWQGTLEGQNGPLRIVLKVAKTESGGWSAVNYSIDQGGRPLNTAGVTLQGGVFKFLVPAINGSYEGKLGADGNSITGNWTQGQNPLPLTFVRATKETAWEIPAPPPPPKMMAADADPTFEVATIKPNNSELPGKGINVNGRNFTTRNTSLADLIKFAYKVNEKQIVGAPEWWDKDKFDITAVVADGEGTPSDAQWHSMMRKLIVERFKLKFHQEKKELSVYVFSVGKDGPKNLTKSLSTNFLPGFGFGPDPGGMVSSAQNATMAEYADMVLQGRLMDRPVLNQTGIEGRYDFKVTFMPDESLFGGHGPPIPTSDNPAPGFFTALQEQLGLKLDAVKAPADVMVIDHVEKPSDN
jgi:uncharacterized protein (TIGR03435 family)